jgi:hypothetical protein
MMPPITAQRTQEKVITPCSVLKLRPTSGGPGAEIPLGDFFMKNIPYLFRNDF